MLASCFCGSKSIEDWDEYSSDYLVRCLNEDCGIIVGGKLKTPVLETWDNAMTNSKTSSKCRYCGSKMHVDDYEGMAFVRCSEPDCKCPCFSGDIKFKNKLVLRWKKGMGNVRDIPRTGTKLQWSEEVY